MSTPTKEQLQEEARRKVAKALKHIDRAHDELSSACAELSAICNGIPVWTSCHSLTDKVHSFWLRVNKFRHGGNYQLDTMHAEALAKKLNSLETPS